MASKMDGWMVDGWVDRQIDRSISIGDLGVVTVKNEICHRKMV